MRPQRVPPNDERRDAWQGSRRSTSYVSQPSADSHTIFDRRCNATMFGVIAADLIADMRRRVVS